MYRGAEVLFPETKRERGTGTFPYYLVNHDDTKNKGPFGEKNCTEIEKQLLDEWSELWVHRES